MKTTLALPRQRFLRLAGLAALAALALSPLAAQDSQNPSQPQPRILSEVNGGELTPIKGSQHPLAVPSLDAGRVPAATKLDGVTIFFNHSAAQEADLQALLKAQQTPGSPQYRQWLTPELYGARFGLADSDIDKVKSWLESEGFSIDSVNNSRNAIHFSGSVAQIERAFGTEMHYYNVGGVKHFAPSTALSVPAAIAPVVTNVGNLDDFRPRPMHTHSVKPRSTKPQYTIDSDGTQYVFFAPQDIWTAYDIKPLISGGNIGTGQTIAIMGQSEIQNVDIENFQNAAGLAVKDPVPTPVPGTGTPTVEADGNEGESDLDIEWSGAIATGATINFVYVGNNPNYGVFDAYQYAVEKQIGNIISMSYGTCETQMTQSEWSQLEAVGAQASLQGQTVVAASGDQGSTACYGYYGGASDPGTTDGGTTWTLAMSEALAVNYPASSQYVLGVGGTEISSADDAVGTYWSSASSSQTGIVVSTATQYIPEIAWNDDAFTLQQDPQCTANYLCLSSSGGGVSTFTARPSWQTGVTGITSGSYRLVPDVALYASPNYPAYLFCTSDESDWEPESESGPAQTGSCGSTQYPFFDPTGEFLTLAGGTSFAAPIFAGELAILNQAQNYTSGQGTTAVATELYTLAANSANVSLASAGQTSAAFHDITTGNNECAAGSGNCSTAGESQYSAGTGYDEVTGLGSLDLANLVAAWPKSTSTLIGTGLTVSASNTAPTVNQSVNFTITVTAASGTVTPAGSVSISVDGGTATSETLTSNGTYVYTTSFTTAGSHTVTVNYAGNTTFGASEGSSTVNVSAVNSGTGTFTLSFSQTSLTVSSGSTTTNSITVTPANGYTGTVVFNPTITGGNTTYGPCVFASDGFNNDATLTVSNTSAVTGTIDVDANGSDCTSEDAVAKHAARGMHVVPFVGAHKTAAKNGPSPLPMGAALAGLMLAGFLGRKSRRLRALACVIALASIGLAMTACGGANSSGGTGIPNPPAGTYTITFTGQDSVTSTITATKSFSLTID